MVCERVNKSDVESAMGITFQKEKASKLPSELPYDYSGCEYTNLVLAEVSINYYRKSNANVYPPGSKTKILKNVSFPAKAVYNKSGDIYELIGETPKGSKILIVLNSSIKENSKQYHHMLHLLEKLIHTFE